eukprot:m.800201 g.800201  ORF g.800201 m.800201 type:complete len:102 (+) comp23354_c2_seq47:1383-1688(+)
MWYIIGDMEIPNELVITRNIESDIRTRIGTKKTFEFGWYMNPKKTIQNVFHVQVFWIVHDGSRSASPTSPMASGHDVTCHTASAPSQPETPIGSPIHTRHS